MSFRNHSNSIFLVLCLIQRQRRKLWNKSTNQLSIADRPRSMWGSLESTIFGKIYKTIVLDFAKRKHYICKYCIIFSNTVIIRLFPRHRWQFSVRILQKYKQYIFSKLKYGMESISEWFALTLLNPHGFMQLILHTGIRCEKLNP